MTYITGGKDLLTLINIIKVVFDLLRNEGHDMAT